MTNVKQAAPMALSENVSQKHIAQTYNISILLSMILNLVTLQKTVV